MSLLHLCLWVWPVMALMMVALWLVQYRTHNAGTVDVAWAFGTGVVGVWFALAAGGGDSLRQWLVASMAAFWGLRLGVHILARVRSEQEDGRYRHLRGQLGQRGQRPRPSRCHAGH